MGCAALTTFDVGTSVTAIGSYVFNGCSKLTTINVQNLIAISLGAFNGCAKLTSVVGIGT
jgi:hypothetical protein